MKHCQKCFMDHEHVEISSQRLVSVSEQATVMHTNQSTQLLTLATAASLHSVSQKVKVEAVLKARQVHRLTSTIPTITTSTTSTACALLVAQVLQQLSTSRPALNLTEVNVSQREARQSFVQRPWGVGQCEDHTSFSGGRRGDVNAYRGTRQQQKAREVHIVVLYVCGQYLQAVGLCSKF
eukprot:7980-Heterococcus_DN1.PRE.1